ncbi:unnamed protein product, partial [Mesorhabditis spiculigera]
MRLLLTFLFCALGAEGNPYFHNNFFPIDEKIEPPCRAGFRNIGGSCYRIVIVGGDHEQARTICRAIGADIDLATIRCPEENEGIYKMTKEQWIADAFDEVKRENKLWDGYSWNMWIGLHGSDAKVRPDPSQWYVDRDMKHYYRNWASKQPDNYWGTKREACAYMYIRESFINHAANPWDPATWNDWECSKTMFAAVCEQSVMTSGQGCIKSKLALHILENEFLTRLVWEPDAHRQYLPGRPAASSWIGGRGDPALESSKRGQLEGRQPGRFHEFLGTPTFSRTLVDFSSSPTTVLKLRAAQNEFLCKLAWYPECASTAFEGWKNGTAWIGGQSSTDNTVRIDGWTDGSPVDFTNFATGSKTNPYLVFKPYKCGGKSTYGAWALIAPGPLLEASFAELCA